MYSTFVFDSMLLYLALFMFSFVLRVLWFYCFTCCVVIVFDILCFIRVWPLRSPISDRRSGIGDQGPGIGYQRSEMTDFSAPDSTGGRRSQISESEIGDRIGDRRSGIGDRGSGIRDRR